MLVGLITPFTLSDETNPNGVVTFLQVSYNGYYPTLPMWRREFDSLHLLQETDSPTVEVDE